MDCRSVQLLKLGSLAVYWNTDTTSFAGLKHEEFIQKFSEMVRENRHLCIWILKYSLVWTFHYDDVFIFLCR